MTPKKIDALVWKMMCGSSVEELAQEGLASKPKLRDLFETYEVEFWRQHKNIGGLLLSGLIHATSIEGLKGILDSGQLNPSGPGSSSRQAAHANVAADLEAVALFNTDNCGRHYACIRLAAMLSVIKFHQPSIILGLDRRAVRAIVGPWGPDIRALCKDWPRQYIPEVEYWNRGPIPSHAVNQVWAWTKQGDVLKDYSHLLSEPERLVRVLAAKPILFGPWTVVR